MKFDDNLPIYLQIMEECKRRMITNIYQPGMKVPPVRELAVEFGVNPNTVQRAMSELEREGLFLSERTSGRFICDDAEKIDMLKKEIMEDKITEFLIEMNQYGCTKEEVITLIKENQNHE